MSYLLDLCYLLVLATLSPAILWVSLRTGKYREGFAQKLFGALPARHGDRPCVWMHAVSVGEVNLLATLIRQFEINRPDVQCLITTTTKTGFQLAQQKYSHHSVAYCPLDFSWAVRRAIRRIRPSLLVLVELEIWPNLIRAARRDEVPVVLINGRISERSFRGYWRIRFLMRHVFAKFTCLAVQTQEYAQRFARLGVDRQRLVVTGSVKFDGAETSRQNSRTRQLCELSAIQNEDQVFLAGSTLEPEEQLAIATFQELTPDFPRLRLIIVPRHPERFDVVAALLDKSGLSWQRRQSLTASLNSDVRVMLVDTVGELGAWWGAADIAFVGGSLVDRGGQNMIEPAAYGAAVCFGPHTTNFRDVVQQLTANQAATVVRNGNELTNFVRNCLTQPLEAAEMGQRAQQLILANLGATARTFETLQTLLPPLLAEGHPSHRISPNAPQPQRKSA